MTTIIAVSLLVWIFVFGFVLALCIAAGRSDGASSDAALRLRREADLQPRPHDSAAAQLSALR